MAQSRRKAREAALRTLYEIEIGRVPTNTAMKQTLSEAELSSDQADYAKRLVEGVRTNMSSIDDMLSARIREYAFDRVAAVDRNVMRIATFELFHMPDLPPAVTLNEAVEIAKKYSTAESGRFVNGVLGKLLEASPKADWSPSQASPDVEEPGEPEPGPEVEEVNLEVEEAKKVAKVGGWTLRDEAED